jgi:hypothetical protein
VTDGTDQASPDDGQVAAVVDYFFEAGTLKRLPRTGWLNAGIKHPESVAEHSYRTGLIGAVLAMMEGADPAKVALMGVVHDTQESRVGDIAYIGRRYLKAADNRDVTSEQTAGRPVDRPGGPRRSCGRDRVLRDQGIDHPPRRRQARMPVPGHRVPRDRQRQHAAVLRQHARRASNRLSEGASSSGR